MKALELILFDRAPDPFDFLVSDGTQRLLPTPVRRLWRDTDVVRLGSVVRRRGADDANTSMERGNTRTEEAVVNSCTSTRTALWPPRSASMMVSGAIGASDVSERVTASKGTCSRSSRDMCGLAPAVRPIWHRSANWKERELDATRLSSSRCLCEARNLAWALRASP